MTQLDVLSIVKSFEGKTVLHDVSLSARSGEVVCLLGPSGCGKTTLLRIIAGLEELDGGEVHLDGRSIINVPVHQRGFGLMFQDFALFPHKNVADNVGFGLRMQGRSSSQIRARVAEMLSLVGLEGYERRHVYDLSGGEQQRVALARSLAPDPRLLLLDEPLGSLDRALREELMNELRAILKNIHMTTLYVTHDQQEAFAVADRVLLMNEGRIVQGGTPWEVYCHPCSPWVARFLGLTNMVPAHVVGTQPVEVDCPLGRLVVPSAQHAELGQTLVLLVPPTAASLGDACAEPGDFALAATVQECSFRGSHLRLVVLYKGETELVFELPAANGALPRAGEPVTLYIHADAVCLLPEHQEHEAQVACNGSHVAEDGAS